MDIINRLHSAFRDCLYFEFGEGYVKFYDQESKKHYKVTIEEEVKVKKAKSETISASEFKKIKKTQ